MLSTQISKRPFGMSTTSGANPLPMNTKQRHEINVSNRQALEEEFKKRPV